MTMFCNWSSMGGWGWGMMGFAWLVLLGVLGLLVWVVLAAARGQGAGPVNDPMRILDERLATGEISPEEYTERRRVLGGSR
jgi:putative membrane protein